MIVQLGDLFICDRPRRSQDDLDFWREYNEWLDGLNERQRPVEITPFDVFFMDEQAAMMYVLRWHGQL